MFRHFHYFKPPSNIIRHGLLGSATRPMNELLRTPITQLTESDRELVNQILKYNNQALVKLAAEDLHIERFEHEVRDKQKQFSFLTDADKAVAFRKERLSGLLKANIFHEIFIDKSLSVSGGVEHGFFRAYLKQHKAFQQETKGAMCRDLGRYIVNLMEGGCFLTLFIGLPTTTLYKADPYTIPVLLLDERYINNSPTEQDIKKTLPGALICRDISQLTEIYLSAYRLAHQKIMDSNPKVNIPKAFSDF